MLFLVVLVVFVAGGEINNFDEIVEEVNSADLPWKAEHNQFSTWSIDEMKKVLGYPSYQKDEIPSEWLNDVEIVKDDGNNDLEWPWTKVPKEFDWRSTSPNCVSPIRNQLNCGSCWAFGTAEAMTDRLCIASKEETKVVMSPQYLVDCDTFLNNGCEGGIPLLSWWYIRDKGIVSDSCVPYIGRDQNCSSHCRGKNNTEPFTKYKTKKTKWSLGTKNIMKDLMDNGPQTAAFIVYEDFYAYKSGIYVHHTGSIVGGHAVKFVGWGENDDGKYWIVANSWGKSWGQDGFFWIKRGKFPLGECLIEGEVVSGIPKVD